MKKLIAVLIALGFLMVMAFPVSAAYDKDDIGELVEKFKKGEGFFEGVNIPSEQRQLINFLMYRIDIKAQLCFSGIQPSFSLVPCEVLKKAYPMIAPFITWVN